MIFFELKKMWRNRTVLWLFLFTVALIFFVNYRSARIRLEDEYPPYRGVPALGAFSANYHRVMRERELQGLSTLEMERDLKIKDGISKDYFSLKAQIPSHFRGYSEEGLELEKIYMKRLEVWNKLLKKYNVSLDFQFDQEDTWQWAMFEKNYAQKHGVHTMSDVVEVPLSNAARRILFNSRFLFGAPVMLCFLFLFGGILSQEREHGTEELLMMQPRKRIHILFSKLLAVWTMALLYVLMLGVLLFLSFLWLNLPIDGFGEIYRVLDPSDPLRYVVGIDLLVRILLSFLMTVALLTGFLFFVSARSEDTMGTMTLLLVLSVWLYVLTEKFSVFQQPWNPVYALDYLQVINGRYSRQWSEVASENFNQYYENVLYGNGLKWYFVFGGVAVWLSFLSLRWREWKLPFGRKEREKVSSSTVLGMERKKVFQTAAFRRTVLGVLTLLLLFFVLLKKEDGNALQNFQNRDFDFMEERLKEKRALFRKGQKKIKMFPTPNSKDKDDPLENAYLNSLSEIVQEMEARLQHEKNIRTYFVEKKGDLFYKSMEKNVKRAFKVYQNGSETFLRKSPSNSTRYETEAIFQKASEENVLPVLISTLYFSAYEEYTDSMAQRRLEKRHVDRSHSAFHLPYRLMKEYRMDIAFLIVVSLIVFGGYIFDKENGEQLSWMYTEPVRRSRYHWIKIGISVAVSVGLFLLFFAFVFMLGGLSEGIGAWNFPVVEYLSLLSDPFQASEQEVLESISLIPLWQYLLRVFLVLVAECFFLSSLSTFLSIFTKKKNQLLAGLALVVGCGVFLSNYLPQGLLRLLSPFHYLQASTVANGAVKIFRNLPQENFWQSVLILVVWGIILGVVGARVVKKRECV